MSETGLEIGQPQKSGVADRLHPISSPSRSSQSPAAPKLWLRCDGFRRTAQQHGCPGRSWPYPGGPSRPGTAEGRLSVRPPNAAPIRVAVARRGLAARGPPLARSWVSEARDGGPPRASGPQRVTHYATCQCPRPADSRQDPQGHAALSKLRSIDHSLLIVLVKQDSSEIEELKQFFYTL
jgi:hypothetical protein